MLLPLTLIVEDHLVLYPEQYNYLNYTEKSFCGTFSVSVAFKLFYEKGTV